MSENGNEAGRSVLVVGASRGLGLSLAMTYQAQGWRVIATTRATNQATPSDSKLSWVGSFDTTHAATVATLPSKIESVLGGSIGVDLAIVVAGVLGDTDPAGLSDPVAFDGVLRTNAFAPLHVIETITDRLSADAPVVVLSSILGSVAANTSGGYDTYRASKAALNTLLRCYAARHPRRTILALHPGWVRTAMGGDTAPIEPDASARDMADVIARESRHPGCRFLDHKGATLPW